MSLATDILGKLGGGVKKYSGKAAGALVKGALPGKVGYRSLLGRGAIAGIGFAGSSVIDSFMETQYAQRDLSGAARFGLNATSFGLKAFGYTQLARGVMGTAGRGAEAAVRSAYNRGTGGARLGVSSSIRSMRRGMKTADNFLSLNPFRAKSMGRYAAQGAGKLALGTARQAGRMLLGIPYAATLPLRLMGNAIGSLPGLYRNPVAARFLGPKGMLDVMTPKVRGPIGRVASWAGIINKDRHAPMMSGLLSLGIAGGAFRAKQSYDYANQNWGGGYGGPGINPANFGAGIMQARRNEGARNFDMATTLSLHRQHSRILR